MIIAPVTRVVKSVKPSKMTQETERLKRVRLLIPKPISLTEIRLKDKRPAGEAEQASLFLVYYNFCRSHASLRLPLAAPQPTRGKGSPKKWQQRTSAMTAGLTDHIWSLREVLLYRIPPWPQVGAKV